MTQPESASIIEGVKSFLVWVAGALAGITAILYACGYLVTRSHLAMLGLYGLVDFGADHFLQEGAKFAITTAYTALRPLLSIVVLLGLLMLAVNGLWSLLANRALGEWLRRTRGKLLSRVSLLFWRKLVYLILLGALLVHASYAFDYFESPMNVVNLLYADPATATQGGLDALVLAGERGKLHGHFEGLLWGTLLAAVLTLTVWRVVSPLPYRNLMRLPFVVTLSLYGVTLPMDYGVLERSVHYGVVSFAGEGGAMPEGTTLFLLDRRSDGFVVWNKTSRRVIWVAASKVHRAEVRAVESLFTKGSGP